VGPLSLLSDVEVAAGIPPGMLNDPSWSVADAFLLLLAYVAAFLIAVRLVAWVDVKLNSHRAPPRDLPATRDRQAPAAIGRGLRPFPSGVA